MSVGFLRLISLNTPFHQFQLLQKPLTFSPPSLPHLPSFFLHQYSHNNKTHSSSSSFSSMDSPPEGYRSNVGICLINSSKKIFSASRLDIPDAWQMPQGGIDEGEDPQSAAIRELREETGVTSVEVLAEVPYWLTYDFPPEVREKLRRQWGSDWKGQAQKWDCCVIQTLRQQPTQGFMAY
ncbi:nudix hydrolase 26, chloroplastic isoform X2 [Beta vulgaris subsp. vulgaris]|uniref:nudix hydrolase 26, chloroplastic isoform X2 n=1 Tax=Beta vulgaris subsp. vulgaris TaxID=3555 RepID=UPI00090055C8|nr:nudix hydrolase 26, chloroplastic isoform X2 [Beta vulgaris subsp. vulgaris]